MKFKRGDLIECIDAKNMSRLTLNEIYRVEGFVTSAFVRLSSMTDAQFKVVRFKKYISLEDKLKMLGL
jgi:hypothetical protein